MRTAENIFSPLSSRITAVVLIMGITYGLHIFFLRFFNYYLQTFIITNFRVIDLNQTLYFKSSRDSIDIAEIQDLMCERNGIIKTVLNFGEIVITLSSAHASKTLRYIPNPEYYFKKINKTKPQYVPQPLQDKRQAGLEGLLSPPLTHIIR